MELHTLGVDGGYTQQDVTEVARCFTGWTIREPQRGGGFEFNDKLHDNGEKHVLGVTIPAGGGMSDGLKVLDILAHHPVDRALHLEEPGHSLRGRQSARGAGARRWRRRSGRPMAICAK